MSKLYIISGSSKGLGKGLVEELISENKVIGLSRSNDFEHPNFKWIPLDFAKPDTLEDIELEITQEVVLINNAGWIGPIKKVGNQKASELTDLFNINVTSQFVLTNQIIKQLKGNPITIINISSGASTNPIDGWSAYCSSKSALDMFSYVLDKELKMQGIQARVYALAPGVIDSSMQADIRSSSEEEFSRLNDFKSMKEEGELVHPNQVAKKIIYLVNHPEKFQEVKVSVRDF